MYRYEYKGLEDFWKTFFTIEERILEKPEQKTSKTVTENDVTTIELDLPGYKKSGISVNVDGDLLLVKIEGDRGNKTYKYTLTETANVSKISSKFLDGVLTIFVPHVVKDSQKSFKIEVE